jgi:hypothetical protein
MVVFRLHDEIHMARPDPIGMALIEAMGATKYISTIPTIPASLRFRPSHSASSSESSSRVYTRRPCVSLATPTCLSSTSPSALEPQDCNVRSALHQDDVDLLIAGEASEWETVEYSRDATAQGRQKALVLIGHQPSEEPGMEQAAKDIRTLFPTLKVDHVPAKQSMWNPDRPPAK